MRRKLVGLEGLIALYQDYRLMTDALFDRLTLDKLVIENSERDWARYNRQVLKRLGLDGVPSAGQGAGS
jgi:ABC-type ATPase involved in cell division